MFFHRISPEPRPSVPIPLVCVRVVSFCFFRDPQDLADVASAALPFSTDEDGADPPGMNPLNSVFDLGKDPLDYFEDRVS